MVLPIDAIVVTCFSGSVNIGATNSQSLAPNHTPALLLQLGPNLKNIDKRIWQKFDNIFLVPGLTEYVSISLETLLRRVIPKIATETVAISETQLRKPIPKISTEVKSISETQLRKFIPKISTEVKSISDSLLRKAIRPLSETSSISEAIKKFVKKLVATETVTISETQLRKPIPKIVTETTAISDSVKRPLILRAISQTISITEALARGIKEIVLISETLKRKVTRKMTAETMSISEVLFGAEFAGITETIPISDSVTRLLKAKRAVIEGYCSLLFNGLGST